MAKKKKNSPVNKISEAERQSIKSSARAGLTAEGTLNYAAKKKIKDENDRKKALFAELERKRIARENSPTTETGRQKGLESSLATQERIRQQEVNRRNNLLIQSSFGTPAAYQPKNALTEKLGQYKTQQSALNNYLKDLNKRKSTMSGLPWDGPVVEPNQAMKQYEKQQEQKWLKALEELYEKNRKVSESGHEKWEASKEEIGKPTISSFNTMNAGRMGERDKGTYDISSNPMYMTGAGLDNFYSKWNQQAADTRKKAEEYRNKGYAGLFDYIEGLDRKNEEAILRGNYTHEQQAAADRTLKELNDTYDARKEEAIENGQRTINGYAKYGPEMFAKTMKNQTKDWLYYLLTGDDYAKRTANMTQEQKAELDEQIEKARESVLNYSQNEYDSMLREADANEHIARQVLEEKATRGKIDEFTNWSRHYDSAEYDPSLVETQDWFDEMLNDPIKEPVGSREDKAYYYMNNRPEEGAPGNTLDYLKKEYFATPEMVDTYNRLFKADKENGTNMAGAFLDAIDPYLTGWETEYTDYFIRNKAENPLSGIAMRLMSYPINAVNAIPSIINTGVAFFDKNAANPNKGINLVNKIITTGREEQNEDIDTALGGTGAVEYLLGIADSIGDNVMAMGTGGLTPGGVNSKAGRALVQLIMSGEATGHTFLEKLEDNTDPTEAALYAIGDGVIEWFTEKVSLEALLNPDVKSMLGNTKQLMKYFGKVSLAEGSEEIASDLLNWGLDYILSMAFDHETELRERYLELIGSGMRDQEASRQALTEKFEQIGLSGLAGAISGGLMGMGRAGINYIGNLQAGSQINDAKNIDKMVDIGLRADEGTISRANAEAVQKRITEGKKVRDAEAGKLAQSIMLETNESFSEKSKEARTTEIARMLRAKGMSAADAQSMSETLDKAVMAGGIENLSKAEQRKINNNKAASSVYNKLAYNAKTQTKVNTKIDAATEAEQRVHNAVSSMFTRTQAMGAKYVGRNRATEDDLRKATGTEVKGPMGVIVLNADRFDNAKLTGVRRVNGQIKYTVEIDGKEQTVDASQIRARNIGTAAIIEKSTNDPHLYNMGYTNKLLQVMNTLAQQEQPDALMMDAYRMRMAAFKGQAMPKALINEKAAKELYDYSRIEYQAIRQEETKEANRNALKPGQGTATFAGYQFGTKEFDDALDSSNMSESEKEKIRVYAALSKAAGTQVAFRSIEEIQKMALTDEDMSIFQGEEYKLYGAESKSGILINLGGENITTDPVTGEKKYSKHDIGVTYGHEFLHYLQRNSLKGYNDIVKYVFDTQAKNKGEAWVNQQLEDYMRKQDIDLNEAIFEFVADSCDSIFSSKEVIDHIVNTNQTLYGEIKSFIKDLFTRVRAALANMRGSMSEAGAQMINTNYRALGKLVNVAWDEAASGQIITPEEYQQMVAEETAEKTRYSQAYSYDNLISKPDMELTQLKDITEEEVSEAQRQTTRDFAKGIVNAIKARNHGTASIPNIDTGKNIQINVDSIKHSIGRDLTKTYIQISRQLDSIVKNAIAVNELNTRDQNKYNYSTMFVGMAETEDEYIAVRLNVENKTWRANNYEILYSVTKDSIEKGGTRHNDALLKRAGTPSTMSIKNILEIVKNSDNITAVLSKDAADELEIERPYKKGLSEYLRYSRAQLDNEYMAAVNMGRYDLAEKMVDEAAKEAGYTIKAYHGTPNGKFTVFDRSKVGTSTDFGKLGRGFYFSSKKQVADYYAGYLNSSTVMPVYLKLNNPFVLDRNYDNMTVREMYDSILGKGGIVDEERSEELTKWLVDNGYDGIIADGEYMVLDPNNIKSAESVTYDNYGDVIPLSERFNEEKTDIRWSRAQLDNEYMAAVESGDESTQREILDAAAAKNGYTKKVYHGTPTGGFTTFRDWSYFTESKAYADRYNHPSQSSTRGYAVDATKPMTYELYFNPGRVFDTRDPETAKIFNQIRMEYGLSELQEDGLPDWTDGRDLIEYIEENDLPYDTIVLNEGADGGYGAPVVSRGESYVTRSNMIKSTDLVTYDDDGQVIPPSERFNDKKSDIRWSRANSVDENYTPELMAVHNLTYYDMLRTLKEGGFTAPSIAIIKSAMGHDKYGEISVLFKKNAFDPKANRLNKIYGADAYTPTRANAHVETELIREELNKAADEIAALVEGMEDNHAYNEINRWFSERNYKEVTTQTAREMAEEAYSNDAFLTAYLKEQGKEIPIKTKERYANPDIKEDRLEGYERIYNAIYNSGRFEEFWNDVENHASGETMMEKWADIAAAAEPQMKRVLDLYREKGGKLARNATYNWIKQTIDWLRGGSEKVTETDWYETRKAMWDMVDRNTFTDWLAAKIEPAFGRKGIRNNEDPFTPIGNRRTWNQLHMPYTIENIVKAMYENADEKAQGGRYATGVVAAASKEYKSLDEVREDRERLRLESEEDYSKIISDLDERLKDLAYDIWPTSHAVFDFAMIEVAKKYAKNQTEAAIRSGFRAEDIRVTQEQVEQVKAFLDEARNIPTGYFEAKPQRVMNFDEIDTVILPENTYGELLDLLDDNDINYEFYDGTSTDRTKKLNSHKDLKFSRWTESGMDVNYWMEHATPSMVQTEDERELISMYRGKRTSISLSLKKQGEYRARIRQLEAVDNPSTDVKSELTALRNKLEIEKKKVYRLEEEILQITRNDGWAGMMYQHNMVFRDYVEGRTQEQVRQTIDDMLKLVEQTQEQVTKDTENLKKLATHQAVQTMKSFMGKTSMGKMASILRKTYNSTMNKAEIEDRLAEMELKQASGKDITGDTEALAHDLLDRMRGIRTDTLESLRGQTLVIGQSLAEELKAENSSIKELQSRIKGSGIKIVTGVKSSTGEIDKHSRISEQWSELRESNAALPDVENMAEIDKLHTIVDFIESELRASTGAEQFGIDFDEVVAMVRASVGNITTYLTDDPKARAQINNLMKQIADLSKATEKTAADMQGLYGKLDDVMQAGARAKGIATAMERDVNEAIKYYNTTARVAAEKERTKVRKALIAQLRDETTQKLLKQQEKYRSMIENNQKARELHLDNEALRRKISTVASRMANRLFAETDQKNVPEETKGLVREVLRMLSENDSVYRKVTNWDKDRIEDAMKRLNRLNLKNGEFVPAKDLDFLVVKAPNEADNDYTMRDKVWQDILAIESGLEEYRAAETSTLVNQQAKNDALTKVQEALSEIYSVIRARSEAFINGRRYEIATLAEQMENEMAGSKYKGERTGKIGRAFDTIEKMVGYGNLTPEYFFKNLKNGVMKILHGGFHDAEQRAGLEALRAKAVVEKIAKDTKYNTWDPQEKHKVKLPGGREIDMTTEQIMALYATWRRESSQLRPEETAHLLKGGFVLAQGDMTEGLYGRQKNDKRPIRMDKATLEGLRNYLTEDQLRYVVELMNYMSGELAEIGNETSMQQYGIKKFTERYYYPIKAWGGVLNKSSASGVENKSDARAMRQSFTKNLTANAQNAIEIGDFTPTVMKHIVGMITFNTVGPAVENMNKVLNQQLTYGEAVYDENGEIAEDNRYKRNVRAVFQDAYGVNALKYLERFMDDVNGGMTRQQDKSLQEKLLSVFRKSAVAGSLSVAAQQPLSYIRAAMKINPVYLARALAPTHWGKIHDEMLKYSGVAVIKDMGRFDMNQGQSMIDFITPEEKTSKARKAGRAAVEATTILPEKMDALTWGRMWIACKLETAAKNKGMDQKSDEFLQKVAQRFNEVMRQTQVYDSMMVKSQNMRSTNYAIKAMTSFMAEPSLSLNVLADAVRNFNEKGGKANMGKAITTFVISAALQAAVKAIMSSGRSPDKKKRLEEQFWTKWFSMFMSEVDPLTLIPGYSDLMELAKNGELADDAWSVIGKIKTAWDTTGKWLTGKSTDTYRNIEDSVGQIAQLFTNVPAKNIMRDIRAIMNFFNPEAYANREHSNAVVKYGIYDSISNMDNIIGVVNKYLKDYGAGYGTANTDYYQRIYAAEKAGNTQAAEEMKEYLKLKSTAEDPQKSMNEGLRKLVKEDDSMTVEEKYQKQKEYGLVKGGSYILGEYEDGNLTRKEAEKLYRKENPKKTDKEVLEAFDKIDWENSGKNGEGYSNYTPLMEAIEANKVEEIRKAADHMLKNGYEANDIKTEINKRIKKEYLAAKTEKEKLRLRDALTKTYKALGYTADEADKTVKKWIKEKK